MRVCHVSLSLATGGLERLLVEFTRHQVARGHEVHCASLSRLGPPAEEITAVGGTVHALRESRGRKIRQLAILTRFLRTLRPDVVHTHNAYAHFYGALAARLAGVRAIIHTRHGRRLTGGRAEGPLFRLSCWLTDAVVAVSEETRRLSLKDGCPKDRCHRIWNGIDAVRFRPSDRPPSRPLLVTVGRLEIVKDIPTLLRSFARAKAQVPDADLAIIGDGSERVRLEKECLNLGIASSVRFLGERNDVPKILREGSLFVNTSLSEGIPLALLEAMACGLPVVATRVGGNVEVVEESVTGVLAPLGDPDAIADAVIELLKDPARLRAMGRAGRERACRLFDLRRMIEDYDQLYAALLKRSGGTVDSG